MTGAGPARAGALRRTDVHALVRRTADAGRPGPTVRTDGGAPVMTLPSRTGTSSVGSATPPRASPRMRRDRWSSRQPARYAGWERSAGERSDSSVGTATDRQGPSPLPVRAPTVHGEGMQASGTGAERRPSESPGSGRSVAVSEIMSRRIVAIRSECDLRVAVDTFLRTALRHLVVVDEDRTCLGIVSSEQVLAALGTRGSREVGDQVASPGLRVHQDAPVRRAAELMIDELVDALPVADDDGRVVGIVTWSDIVRLVARRDLLG